MKHNIYLLEPTEEGRKHITYDCNCGQVIIADNEEEARKLCNIKDEGGIWMNMQLTICTKIGESNKQKGIALVSNRGA